MSIYGRKERRTDDDGTAKLTARKLVPIKSTIEFEKHVGDVIEVVRKRQGRDN